VVLALVPTKGITLPLISYGGTSVFITLASLGVLLNLTREID
jgi:cell division protein FtsW